MHTKSILAALIMICSLSINAQKSINGLFKDFKKGDITFAVTIPGWLVKTGMEVADNYDQSEELLSAQKIINKIRKYRILVAEDLNLNTEEPLRKFYDRMQRDKFEPYLKVKNGDVDVGVFVREKKNKIEDIFVMATGDTTVLLHLDTKISYEELEDLDIKGQIEQNSDQLSKDKTTKDL